MIFTFKTFINTYATITVSRIFRPKNVFDTPKWEKTSPCAVLFLNKRLGEIKFFFEKVFPIDTADDFALSADAPNEFVNTFRSLVNNSKWNSSKNIQRF